VVRPVRVVRMMDIEAKTGMFRPATSGYTTGESGEGEMEIIIKVVRKW